MPSPRPTEQLRAEIAAHVRSMPDDGLLAMVAAQIRPKRGRPIKGEPDVARELVGLRILIEGAVKRLEAGDVVRADLAAETQRANATEKALGEACEDVKRWGKRARDAEGQVAELSAQLEGQIEATRERGIALADSRVELGQMEAAKDRAVADSSDRFRAVVFRAEAAEEALKREQESSAGVLEQGLAHLARAEAAKKALSVSEEQRRATVLEKNARIDDLLNQFQEMHAAHAISLVEADRDAIFAIGWQAIVERDHARRELACSDAAFQKIHAEWMPRGAFDDALETIGARGARIEELLTEKAAWEKSSRAANNLAAALLPIARASDPVGTDAVMARHAAGDALANAAAAPVVGLEIAADDTDETSLAEAFGFRLPGPADALGPRVVPTVPELSPGVTEPPLEALLAPVEPAPVEVSLPPGDHVVTRAALAVVVPDDVAPIRRGPGRPKKAPAAAAPAPSKKPKAAPFVAIAPMAPMAPMRPMAPMSPMSWEVKPVVTFKPLASTPMKLSTSTAPVSLASLLVEPEAVKDGDSRIFCRPMTGNISALNCLKNQALLARTPETEGAPSAAKNTLRMQLRTVEKCKGCTIGPRVTKQLHKLGVRLTVVPVERPPGGKSSLKMA